jgi:hypothetical protein
MGKLNAKPIINCVDRSIRNDPKKTVIETRAVKAKESNSLSIILCFFALTIPKQKMIDNNSM